MPAPSVTFFTCFYEIVPKALNKNVNIVKHQTEARGYGFSDGRTVKLRLEERKGAWSFDVIIASGYCENWWSYGKP